MASSVRRGPARFAFRGYLCNRACKQDAASDALAPALDRHGAALLDRCTVQRLEATANRVERVVCESDGEAFSVTAPVVVLAAGALNTAWRILLDVKSDAQRPQGLMNRSGRVGCNPMRHYTDLYAVTPRPARRQPRQTDRIPVDFYDGAAPAGSAQFSRLAGFRQQPCSPRL